MARKDCLPAARACEHASGDSLRVSSGHAWRSGGGGSRGGFRNRLLVSGQTSRGHGRRGTIAAISGRMVAGHHFLFPGNVFLLQNAHVGKKTKAPAIKKSDDVCASTA